MMSFLTERINLKNAILRDSRGKDDFAPWLALLKHRGVEEGAATSARRREDGREGGGKRGRGNTLVGFFKSLNSDGTKQNHK